MRVADVDAQARWLAQDADGASVGGPEEPAARGARSGRLSVAPPSVQAFVHRVKVGGTWVDPAPDRASAEARASIETGA